MRNSRTSLNRTNREALDHLEACVDAADDGTVLTRETAVACLTDGAFEATEAREQIEQLLLKGYLYEVEGELRIPPRSYE